MTTFAGRMRSVANTLLSKYGRSVTFTRYVTGEYNPVTGAVVNTSSTTYSGVAHPSSYSLFEVASTNVQQDDIDLLIYTTIEPLIEDICSVDLQTYKVMNVDKIVAQNSVIVYKVQLRK